MLNYNYSYEHLLYLDNIRVAIFPKCKTLPCFTLDAMPYSPSASLSLYGGTSWAACAKDGQNGNHALTIGLPTWGLLLFQVMSLTVPDSLLFSKEFFSRPSLVSTHVT